MNAEHELTQVAGRWRVDFKRRAFARDYQSKEEAETVISADKVYAAAERMVLYSALSIDDPNRETIARQLRESATSLETINIGDFTIRGFHHVADILDPPAP